MTEAELLEVIRRGRAEVRTLQRIIWVLAARLGGIRIKRSELADAPHQPHEQLAVYRNPDDGTLYIDTKERDD